MLTLPSDVVVDQVLPLLLTGGGIVHGDEVDEVQSLERVGKGNSSK